MIFKKKPYKNVSIYVTAGELKEWLELVPEDTTIRVPDACGSILLKDMNYHEITGVVLS